MVLNPTRLGALALALLVSSPATAGDLYFAEITPGFTTGHVSKIKPDGTGFTRLIETGAGIRAIAVDPVDGKVYWTDVYNYVIARSNLDGSGPENVVTSGLIFPAALAIDPVARSMYWLDQDNWLASSSLDGSGFAILSETVTHRGVAVDHAAGKIYWSTSDTMFKGKILKANLDGSGVQVVVTSNDTQFKPNAIALDLAGGKIYWTDYVLDVLGRANLDGTDVQFIWSAGGNFNPRGITLDLAAGKIYWGQDNDFDATSGRIMSANLDGTSPHVVINDIGLANYIEFVPDSPGCPADFDGSGFVDTDDFDAFIHAFEAGTDDADFDNSGFVDTDDFDAFVHAFELGC